MMSMRTKTSAAGSGLPLPLPTQNTTAGGGGGGRGGGSADGNWEMRPGGMLVQSRSDSDQNRPPPPSIRVRVKYGSVYHDIVISSQATFGELKKILTGPTGLHHDDQKLFFKDKERDSKAFLDTTGVKNKSKIVLIKDSINQQKRYLEMRRAAKLEKATKSISDISLEVDKLAGQVAAVESVISRGGEVTENYVVNLIELLMNQLLQLDGILEDVDATVQMQGKIQVKRVQDYVETLDMLKIKNSMPKDIGDATSKNSATNGNGNRTSTAATNITMQEKSSPSKQQEHRLTNEQVQSPVQKQQDRQPFGVPIQPQQQPLRHPHQQVPSPVQLQQGRQSVGLLKRPQQQMQQPSRQSYELELSPVQLQERRHSTGTITQLQPLEQLLQPSTHSASRRPVVITTQWETFDSFPVHTSTNHPLASTASTSIANGLTQPALNWDLL